MFSCDFLTFHWLVDKAFDWPNLGCFRLAEFGLLYFSRSFERRAKKNEGRFMSSVEFLLIFRKEEWT